MQPYFKIELFLLSLRASASLQDNGKGPHFYNKHLNQLSLVGRVVILLNKNSVSTYGMMTR